MTQNKFKLSNFKLLGLPLGLLCALFSANILAVAVPALDAAKLAPLGITALTPANTADIAGATGYNNLDGYMMIVNAIGGKTAADITTANFDANYNEILDLAKAATWAAHLIAQNPAFLAAAAAVAGSAEEIALNGAKDIFNDGLHIDWATLIASGNYQPSASATYNIPWFSDIGGGVKGYNVPDATGRYALDRARANGDVDLIAILEAQGDALFTAASVHSAETLVNAAKTGNKTGVTDAIAAGINVNDKNAEGDTALIAATLALDAEMVDLLLGQAGIDKELTGKAGRTAAGLLRNKGRDEAAALGFTAAADTKNKAAGKETKDAIAVYDAKRKAVSAKLKA